MEHMDQNDVAALLRGEHVPNRPAKQPPQRFKGRDRSKYGKRHTPGAMNATESAYAERLREKELKGEILQWYFEAVTFKLASDCRYTPDFCVQLPDCSMEFVDSKGGGPI